MEIKLSKLMLENFKGVRSFTLETGGRNCTVRGDNGTGKTTLMDAFLWLLFGKDSQGKADFAIKTLDKDGQEIHNLNHAVEAVLDLDGRSTTLKKVFTEKWTKKRGTPKPMFSGHTTDHFIDGVPAQKKEWDAQVTTIINEEIFKLLTSPTYFNSLHWQRRRNVLLQVCGDVSDADVIASDIALANLPDILAGQSLEDHRKVVAGKKKEVNDRLKEIPARIDELHKSMTDSEAYNLLEINAAISKLEVQIQETKDDTKLSALRKQKSQLEAELAEAKQALTKTKDEAQGAIDKEAAFFERDRNNTQNKVNGLDINITHETATVIRNEEAMERLRSEYKAIMAQGFDGPSVCPTCGQDLPADQVAAAMQKHNEDKAWKLNSINEQGKKLKAKTDLLKETLAMHTKEKAQLEKYLKDLAADIEAAEKRKEKAAEEAGKAEAQDIENICAKIAQIDEALNAVPTVDTSSLETELKAERAKLAEIEAAKKIDVRIQALMAEEKTLAAEYERLERETFIMEKFIVAKVDLLEDRINERFDLARFKLFNVQINGGIEPTCITLYEGVPWGAGLNTGAEINVGLDIVKTLSEHYGIKAPTWIDHAESVTEILETGSQTIKLAVNEDCPKLEVIYYD